MEKILISAGVVLSLGGVWLMIRASIYKDPKTGKKWAHRHDPKSWMVKWGWICLIGGVITQLIGTWFPQFSQGISSAFAGTSAVKNLLEAEETSLIDKILNDPSLIIASLALIATICIAFASVKSVITVRNTSHAQLYLKLFEEYASEKMKDALEQLNEDQEWPDWGKLVKKYPEGGHQFIEALKKSNISGVLEDPKGQNARRYVKYYFIKARRLYELKFLSEGLLKQLGSVAGINLLYDVVAKLEEDTKAREEIEEIKRICGRYDEGGDKG